MSSKQRLSMITHPCPSCGRQMAEIRENGCAVKDVCPDCRWTVWRLHYIRRAQRCPNCGKPVGLVRILEGGKLAVWIHKQEATGTPGEFRIIESCVWGVNGIQDFVDHTGGVQQ